MRALTREWDVKTVAMRESKDLNDLELHDFFADLKVYEFKLETRKEEEPSESQPTKALAASDGTQVKTGRFAANCTKPKKDDKNHLNNEDQRTTRECLERKEIKRC
ncbi:hypothetical protein F511_05631 [Dorcoceras hygrometricum]|uniref:Uncharacterized protein n=1 Tax=Dorcoceras hygrometricum TaxID=472368 RepID=A0A2Z7CW55_9LAMI|nr:hypothetical protein F511_05631 [Dorcoceras hygrometricum]